MFILIIISSLVTQSLLVPPLYNYHYHIKENKKSGELTKNNENTSRKATPTDRRQQLTVCVQVGFFSFRKTKIV